MAVVGLPQSTIMLLNYVYLHVSHMTCMEDASVFWNVVSPAHTCRIIYMYTHTHTHVYIYIYCQERNIVNWQGA